MKLKSSHFTAIYYNFGLCSSKTHPTHHFNVATPNKYQVHLEVAKGCSSRSIPKSAAAHLRASAGSLAAQGPRKGLIVNLPGGALGAAAHRVNQAAIVPSAQIFNAAQRSTLCVMNCH